MVFRKCLVTDQFTFRLTVGDFLFGEALDEGFSVDDAVAALWDACRACCDSEKCEAFIILMDDGTYYEFEVECSGEYEKFRQFVQKYLGDDLLDYEAALQRTKTA